MNVKPLARRAARALGVTAALLAPTLALPASPASAATIAIAGATRRRPCTWITSPNVRSTTASNAAVAVQIDDTGELGVKMRTRDEATGAIGATQYFPAGTAYLPLTTYAAKGTRFRLQFTCRTERKGSDRPDTDFAGSLRY